MKSNTVKTCIRILFAAAATVFLLVRSGIAAEAGPPLELQPLIDEALRNNHDVAFTESSWRASLARVPQAESLPDPMIMVGVQNEGWKGNTYGKMAGAMRMYSVSQMLPFWGKRSLRGEMAERQAEGAEQTVRMSRLKAVATVKERYFDLFFAHRSLEIVRDKVALFTRIEQAALARYAAGRAPQQEVLMAQTEKYMLLEREAMLDQRKEAAESMLNMAVGRTASSPLGVPEQPEATVFAYTMDELVALASDRSPEIAARRQQLAGAEAGVRLSEREYWPDLTLAAEVDTRPAPYEDMWSVKASFTVPLYFGARNAAIAEAKARSSSAEHDLVAVKLMLEAGIRDNLSMLNAAGKLMDLYKEGLIPKTYQDFESAIAGYRTGSVNAITVISRLKTLLDYETQYWQQFTEREKSIARLEALTGLGLPNDQVKNDDTY